MHAGLKAALSSQQAVVGSPRPVAANNAMTASCIHAVASGSQACTTETPAYACPPECGLYGVGVCAPVLAPHAPHTYALVKILKQSHLGSSPKPAATGTPQWRSGACKSNATMDAAMQARPGKLHVILQTTTCLAWPSRSCHWGCIRTAGTALVVRLGAVIGA